MKTVTIHGIDNGADAELGTITLDDGKLWCQPADDELLERILADPSDRGVKAKDDPEAWLTGLHRVYRSAYLRASKASDDK